MVLTAARRVEFCSSSKEKRDQWVEAISTRHAEVAGGRPLRSSIASEKGRRSIMASITSSPDKEGWLWFKSLEAPQVAAWIKYWGVLKGATLKTYSRDDLEDLEGTHTLAHLGFKTESGGLQQQVKGENLFLFQIVPPKRTYAFSPGGEWHSEFFHE
jgi:hypothetical protein